MRHLEAEVLSDCENSLKRLRNVKCGTDEAAVAGEKLETVDAEDACEHEQQYNFLQYGIRR